MKSNFGIIGTEETSYPSGDYDRQEKPKTQPLPKNNMIEKLFYTEVFFLILLIYDGYTIITLVNTLISKIYWEFTSCWTTCFTGFIFFQLYNSYNRTAVLQ